MLQKSKSNRVAKFKYVLIVPVLCAMLFYVSCSVSAINMEDSGQAVLQKDTPNFQVIKSGIGNSDLLTIGVLNKSLLTEDELNFIKASKMGIGLRDMREQGTSIFDYYDEFFMVRSSSFIESLAAEKGITIKELSTTYDDIKENEIEEVTNADLENIPNFTVTTSLQKGKPSLLTVILRDKSLLTEGELDFVKAAKKAEIVLDSKDVGKGDFSQYDEFFLVRSSSFLQKLAIEKEVTIEVVSLTNNQDQTYDIEQVPNSELENIPFAVIDKVPTYTGCTGTNQELKTCMSDAISKFVNQNFNTALGKSLGLTGVNRIFVSFRIDKTGKITNIRSRAPHPDLEKEAIRVIRLIPDMEKPGEQGGRPVGVLYSLPITFNIAE